MADKKQEDRRTGPRERRTPSDDRRGDGRVVTTEDSRRKNPDRRSK